MTIKTTDTQVTEEYLLRKGLSFVASLQVCDNDESNRENLRIAIQTARNILDESF